MNTTQYTEEVYRTVHLKPIKTEIAAEEKEEKTNITKARGAHVLRRRKYEFCQVLSTIKGIFSFQNMARFLKVNTSCFIPIVTH